MPSYSKLPCADCFLRSTLNVWPIMAEGFPLNPYEAPLVKPRLLPPLEFSLRFLVVFDVFFVAPGDVCKTTTNGNLGISK